jgi:hypothetical protein
VGNNRGEVRDSSITHGGAVLPAPVDLGDAKVEVDGIVGSETIEITTIRFERSQVLELFRETSLPLDSMVIP